MKTLLRMLRYGAMEIAQEISRLKRLAEFSLLNPSVRIGSHVVILGDPKRIQIGTGSTVEDWVVLDVRHGGQIRFGRNTQLRSGATIATYGGTVTFGDNCGIQQDTIVYGHGGVKAGDYVWIAALCVVVPANHGTALIKTPMYEQPLSKQGINMGDDIWIGSRCCVLDGVSIGSGAVVAAGAVVNQDVEANMLVGGVPAKVIRSRSRSLAGT